MHRLLQNRNLPAVIRCMLRDAVKHRGDGALALWSVCREILIAHTCNDLPQSLVALGECSSRLRPAFLGDGARSRPVLALGWLNLAAGDASSGDVCPGGYVEHELPDVVRRGNSTLNGILGAYPGENFIQRWTMPCVAEQRAADLVGDVLTMASCAHRTRQMSILFIRPSWRAARTARCDCCPDRAPTQNGRSRSPRPFPSQSRRIRAAR